MTIVFADSFYFFSLVNPNDPTHQRAIAFTKSFAGKLVTTGWVITELGDGWAKPASHRAVFASVVADLQSNPNMRVVPFSDSLLQEGIALYARRSDKEWSLTDCISFVVMEGEGITEALTGDRHFEQAGFVALLK